MYGSFPGADAPKIILVYYTAFLYVLQVLFEKRDEMGG
jgi:hypothetical protein